MGQCQEIEDTTHKTLFISHCNVVLESQIKLALITISSVSYILYKACKNS
jgi:hypothetical protein